MTDEIKFKEYLSVLSEIHDRQITPMLASVYWKILEPFTDDQCETAFEQVIQSAKFFPKPADLLEILRGKPGDITTIAWVDVVETIRRVGPYESVMFADPVIHEVIEFMGGWSATGDWLEAEMVWKQKEFEKLYSIMMSSSRKSIPYLAGIHERNNAINGHKPSLRVVKIGFGGGKTKMIECGEAI